MTRFLMLLTIILFTACTEEGDEYNYDLLGTVFETTGSFTSANNYTLLYEFPQNFTVYDGDVVMVYILWDQTDANLDVWRPLPQSIFLTDGSFQYNFDYTLYDVQIYVEVNFDQGELTSGDLQNQIFRIAVIPGELAKSESVNINDFASVMKASKLSGIPVQVKSVN